MSTKTLLPTSISLIPDRYFFRSNSSASRTRSNGTSSPQRKRYKYSPNTTEPYPNIYNFSVNQNERRSHSSDTNRHYFSLENTTRYPSQTFTYLRSGGYREPRSVTFIDGSSTFRSDTPYLFSTSNYPHLEDTWTYRQQRISPSGIDSSVRTRSISPEYRQSTRMDTVTSTNGLLSVIKRPPAVHFEPSLLSPSARSYLHEARERLSGRRDDQSPESFERSVDRLVSSVHKKYGQQQSLTPPSTSSSSNYISQYYAKDDERTFASDDEHQKYSYNLNINRTHTQIMKSVNKSLIDRSYHSERTRLKTFEENVHRYLRFYESQALERELNYDLIRCFSSSYLQDLRQEELRQRQIRSQRRSYTYEDIQDIHVPSILEAYKMKVSMNRERQQLSISTGQLSPISSSGYSPMRIGSSHENLDTHSGGFETDRRSTASISQISAVHHPHVDVFYEIMQESFRGIDASIAGHVSKASRSRRTMDVDIKSNSSFWSDDGLIDPYPTDSHQRKSIPNQRKISRYLSTVNRSLLDRPGDLIADFYLSQLNRNMQESVQHIESISRDKAVQQESLNPYERSLSAEHLYQVRKEHLRYRQPFTRPTSFTAEDVMDIYKPFVLENYKRKIAIELERRRRERQGQLISTSSMCTSNTNVTPEVRKSIHRPRTYNDFSMISPPNIVQTKEIIMGRARRTLTNDGSNDVVQHISGVSPPPVYAIHQRTPTIQTNIRITATINAPDFTDRYRKEEPVRPHANIYTNIAQVDVVRLSRANRVESDSESLSMAHVEPVITLNQYEINALADQSMDGSIRSYVEQNVEPRRSILVIPLEEHLSTMHETIPIIEILPITNLPIPPSINQAHEISDDSRSSLNISRTHQPPMIFHSPHTQVLTHHHEPLPEINGTIIRNEFAHIEHVSLASLLEEFRSTKQKHHATPIIDDDCDRTTYEKVEENARVPIVVDETEWTDEAAIEEFSLNIQNAEYKSHNIRYEHATVNLPSVFGMLNTTNEQVQSLVDDSHLLRHAQQSNIRIDQLENPAQTTDLLTFNYPYYNQNFSTHSQTSSLIDMETFLNNFEESIDHAQHLPLINQISVSYAASMNDQRHGKRYPSLPIEWYQPTTLSLHDEQLVEQWTVENNLDTIQHEGTLHRRQVEFFENVMSDAFCLNEPFDEGDVSHCSPTSDYESESVERDNETLIIPLTILPSSSITNLTLLSQSSSHLTSHAAPIVYFLDVLALEEKERKNSTKDFLLTLGFGRNQMHELTNTVATFDQPLRPTWINRSLTETIERLPTSIHYENLLNEQKLHFAVEHQIEEEEETALLIYPHRLQFGHEFGENTQSPLNAFYEPSYLHLPMVNEIHKYQMSFHRDYPNFYPQILDSKIHHDDIFSPNVCQINQPEIFAYAQMNYILDNREEMHPIAMKFDQTNSIEHYHIQSLLPSSEAYYLDINQPDLRIDHFLANLTLIKPSQREDDFFQGSMVINQPSIEVCHSDGLVNDRISNPLTNLSRIRFHVNSIENKGLGDADQYDLRLPVIQEGKKCQNDLLFSTKSS